MELYKEILAEVSAHQEIQITFPNLQINPTEIVELKSYQALQKIKAERVDKVDNALEGQTQSLR